MSATKLNIAQIARMAGLNYRTVYSYVKAERRPSPEAASLLAAAAGQNSPEAVLAIMSKDPEKIRAALHKELS